MPNNDHLRLLLSDVAGFNAWVADLPADKGPWLENSDLRGVTLVGADLRRSQLLRADGADLRNADLSGSDQSGSFLPRTDLRGTNLSDTLLTGCFLHGAWYDEATKLPTGFDPERAGMVLVHEPYERFETSADTIGPQQLPAERLAGANLENKLLFGLDLSERDLVAARFTRSRLKDVSLRAASCASLTARDAHFERCDFGRVHMRAAIISSTSFVSVDLTDANLSDANLSGASMRDTQLRGTNLRGANLIWVEWQSVDIRGADLTGARLCPALMTDVVFDEDTIWPDGTMSGRVGTFNSGPPQKWPGWAGGGRSLGSPPDPLVVDELVSPHLDWVWSQIYCNCDPGCCGLGAFDLRRDSLRTVMDLNPDWAGPFGPHMGAPDPFENSWWKRSINDQDLLQAIDGLRSSALELESLGTGEVSFKRMGALFDAPNLAAMLRYIADSISHSSLAKVEFS